MFQWSFESVLRSRRQGSNSSWSRPHVVCTMPRPRSRPASHGASPPCWSNADLLLSSGPKKRRSALPTLAELQLMRKFRRPALFCNILEAGSNYPELIQIMNTRLICQPRRNAPRGLRGICAAMGVFGCAALTGANSASLPLLM